MHADTPAASASSPSTTLEIDGKTFTRDTWTNVTPSILNHVPRKLHLQPNHPIALTRQIITSRFAAPTYKHYANFSPAVTTHQCFDSLGIDPGHPGRAPSDTYYLDAGHVLRTHSSAHQADVFRTNASDGFTISADVYRRDAVDRSHYPVFHQMEGARTWDRTQVPKGDVADAVWKDLLKLPKHNLVVEDPNPTVHPQRNPLQAQHALAEVEPIAAHLKKSLEDVFAHIFKTAALATGQMQPEEPLRMRWIEAFFPFTSPSWELEIFWQGDWLEMLGCGVVQQRLLDAAGVPERIGWAWGIGLERVAMLLYGVPDIRLFWSQDQRFLSQFKDGEPPKRFTPFSKYPPSERDVAFWVKSTSAAGGSTAPNARDFHENDIMEIVRDTCGETVEDVRLVDEFTHPSTGRKSFCYRIVYRSLERTLTNEEVNAMHEKIRQALTNDLGVELR